MVVVVVVCVCVWGGGGVYPLILCKGEESTVHYTQPHQTGVVKFLLARSTDHLWQ